MTTSEKIIVPEHIKGLLFDCDGTLVDSMKLHMEAWDRTLRKFGARYNEAYFASKRGMKETEIVQDYNIHFNLQLDPNAVVLEKHQYFSEHLHTLQPIEEVVEIVHQYKSILPMAVVSGSVHEIVIKELEIIGISQLFKCFLTADDPFKQKPAPDMFLEAAHIIQVPPLLCQVFEDGDLGLQAAKSAGMLATDVRPYYNK